jgi:hypothetical protein
MSMSPLPPPAPRMILMPLLRYLLGMALGSVPLGVMVLVGLTIIRCPLGDTAGVGCTSNRSASSTLAYVFGVLYFAAGGLMLLLFGKKEWYAIGYGVLTMLVVSPVVAVPACIMVTSPPPA